MTDLQILIRKALSGGLPIRAIVEQALFEAEKGSVMTFSAGGRKVKGIVIGKQGRTLTVASGANKFRVRDRKAVG